MENHGLGHLPQPDNFTTIGNNLGIEINQYNCPISVMIFISKHSGGSWSMRFLTPGLQQTFHRRDEVPEGEGRRGEHGDVGQAAPGAQGPDQVRPCQKQRHSSRQTGGNQLPGEINMKSEERWDFYFSDIPRYKIWKVHINTNRGIIKIIWILEVWAVLMRAFL